jgi:hypothetical protein
MRQIVCSALLTLLLLPLACNRSGDADSRSGDPEQRPRKTAFGHMGKVKSGALGQEMEGRIPFFRDGDLMVYAPMSGYPGKPLGLAHVLIMRLAPGVGFHLGSGLTTDGNSLEMSPVQKDSKGRDFRFTYRVSGKPPVEEFAAGGKTYKPESGRVFLVDLTADPPGLSQVQVDLEGLLARPDEDPTLEELKTAVEKLAGKEKGIRDFLATTEKK